MAILGKMDQILAPKGFSITIAPLGAVCAVLFATPSTPAARVISFNSFCLYIHIICQLSTLLNYEFHLLFCKCRRFFSFFFCRGGGGGGLGWMWCIILFWVTYSSN